MHRVRRGRAERKDARRRLAGFVASALLAATAQAGRPLATEDADTLGKGACEWESFAARASASGSASTTAWVTQGACGVGWNSQAALAIGRAHGDGPSVNTFGLVGKTGLLARADSGPRLTLAWGLTAASSTRSSLAHDGSSLALVATSSLADDLTAHANLGWTRSEADSLSSTTWNLAMEWRLPRDFEVMGEIYGDDRDDPWLGVGVRYTASDRLHIDASYSVRPSGPQERLVTLGFKLGF